MRFKVVMEAHKGKTKRECIIEASNAEEYSKELAIVQGEWIVETGILNFTTTVSKID